MNCLGCGCELVTGDDMVGRMCNYCNSCTVTATPGWICQKCGRSYSPYVTECGACNNHIDHIYSGNTSSWHINPKW